MTKRLHEAEKQADESERARRVLEDRGQSDDDRLTRLQGELDDVSTKNNEVEERYKQVELFDRGVKLFMSASLWKTSALKIAWNLC